VNLALGCTHAFRASCLNGDQFTGTWSSRMAAKATQYENDQRLDESTANTVMLLVER